ncbi:MAG: GTPase ObgE [Mycoplasmoidaceae bacterium]|nr:MAG: GTPase ObgE [Mycoplasmoidaceae bacterium]
MQFVDECKIYLKAGDGGDGIVSWRREKSVPEGGPDGGEGGRGAHVIILGDHNSNTLFDLRNKKHIIAPNGGRAGGQKLSGRGGEDVYVHVPIGTTIYDSNTGTVLCDILESGQKFIICKGGKGGHGNAFFKSSFNRIPTLHERGDLGEEKNVEMKLRYIADVGLVGLPNAGKSTLISNISNAKPKIANYQFTTLTPVLGTVTIKKASLLFEDVPGLIEGASDGKGLGVEFLKHIERCYVLVHMISLSKMDNEDIVSAYTTITNELKQYGKGVAKKKILLVGNKIDCNDCEENIKKLELKLKKKIFVISAKNKTNTDKLVNKIFKQYSSIISKLKTKLKKSIDEKQLENINIRRRDENDRLIGNVKVIKQDDHIYKVDSEYLTYWIRKIPLDTPDNNIRFAQKIETSKAEKKAKELGAVKGDTLIIGTTEFDID